MKYRIKEVKYTHDDGKKYSVFFPQHKHWWCPWWHYFGESNEFSDYMCFDNFDYAKSFIEREKKEDIIKFVYYNID